jgi:hypothetical protein
VVELNELPVDPTVVKVEMPCPVLVEIPEELVCGVPTVELVPVAFDEKVTADVRGVVPTYLNKR